MNLTKLPAMQSKPVTVALQGQHGWLALRTTRQVQRLKKWKSENEVCKSVVKSEDHDNKTSNKQNPHAIFCESS
jgi:hypothetical protein